jgi:hypothetical protein
MDPIIPGVVMGVLGGVVLASTMTLLLKFSGNAEKAAFDLWDEPAAPTRDTKEG